MRTRLDAVDRAGRRRRDRPGGRGLAARRHIARGARTRSRPSSSARSAKVCRSPTATRRLRAIRADIKRRIAQGQSDADIRQAYVDRYGEEILLQPQSSGISLLVWILPVVVLVVGALGIGFVLARNRREPKLHATEADEQLVERAREQQ